MDAGRAERSPVAARVPRQGAMLRPAPALGPGPGRPGAGRGLGPERPLPPPGDHARLRVMPPGALRQLRPLDPPRGADVPARMGPPDPDLRAVGRLPVGP